MCDAFTAGKTAMLFSWLAVDEVLNICLRKVKNAAKLFKASCGKFSLIYRRCASSSIVHIERSRWRILFTATWQLLYDFWMQRDLLDSTSQAFYFNHASGAIFKQLHDPDSVCTKRQSVYLPDCTHNTCPQRITWPVCCTSIYIQQNIDLAPWRRGLVKGLCR